MTPYYERHGITIYHGDCREILPSLSADVVLTDPPYGVGGQQIQENQVSNQRVGRHAGIYPCCGGADCGTGYIQDVAGNSDAWKAQLVFISTAE